MADKGPGSTNRSTNKRLAGAKIKPTENGIKSSKGRAAAEEQMSKAEQKRARKQKITAIAVGVFAVIMALSMMLPSLTYIFGNNNQQAEEQAQEQEEAQTTDDASTEDEAEESTATGMDLVDANYKAVVDPLEAKLSENPKDLATLLNLGNDYMAWASDAYSYATDDESLLHVNELFDKAIGYFDSYLELNDSIAVKTSRAMCLLYKGDTDDALASLQELTDSEATSDAEPAEYGRAWANMGYIYEYQGETEKAEEAYQQAKEHDKDDEYGAKSYADQRLAAMAARTGDGLTDETAESAEGTSTSSSTGAQALEDALGVGF